MLLKQHFKKCKLIDDNRFTISGGNVCDIYVTMYHFWDIA